MAATDAAPAAERTKVAQPVVGDAAGEVEATAPVEPRASYTTAVSIDDLGYVEGFTFQGGTTVHGHTFAFPGPRDTAIDSARFLLVYRASPMLNELANVRVSVEGVPVRGRQLSRDGGLYRLAVPIPAESFRDGGVDVTVQAALPTSDDRCMDERLGAGYLHILPQSGMTLDLAGRPGSLRDAWALLPETVTVSLPRGRLSERAFMAAWAAVDMLYRQGHEVRFARLPELGHVVLGARTAIAAALAAYFPEDEEEASRRADRALAAEGKDVFLVSEPEAAFIALSAPFDVRPAYLLGGKWLPLAAGRRYGLQPLQHPIGNGGLPVQPSGNDVHSLPLSNLGLDTGRRFIGSRTEWQVVVAPGDLPPQATPEHMSLKVIAPVRTTKNGYELYVYLNDVLLRAKRLEPSGRFQELTLSLPRQYQKQVNRIRLVVQRDGVEGDCLGAPESFPIQIAPDSSLVVKRDTAPPARFAELSRYLGDGFDVFLAARFLRSPDALRLVGRLSADFPLQVDFDRVRFVGAQGAVQPRSPFIALGDMTLEGVMTPVSFDQGAVRVVDGRGNTLLDADSLPGLAVAQLVRADNSGLHGLWVRTAAGKPLPTMGELNFSQDDVAFVDHSGVVLTLDSDAPSLAKVHYPDITTWLDLLAAYRFWILALAWLALTLAVIYLYRKSRQHDTPYESSAESADGEAAGPTEDGR